MRGLERYVGEVLDSKYRLERLLGQGGMGAVYLATHLGTERFVALKLIAPDFMRNDEFVERFKREARAAGRLRHPNVVDVTDFGFAQTGNDRLAYLVMEYLDGCTLGDVLVEEKRLPLEWVVDILEQVGSAVHEAHQQGIVHRDLKPDNIWLEPTRLGGYRVKVLDFGIAKLAETKEPFASAPAATLIIEPPSSATPFVGPGSKPDLKPSDLSVVTDLEKDTLLQIDNPTLRFEDDAAQTRMFERAPAPAAERDGPDSGIAVSKGSAEEIETQIFSAPPSASGSAHGSAALGVAPVAEIDNTSLFDQGTQRMTAHSTAHPSSTAATEGLTRVGAIMGTPLYMSPEQCRGEHLDARADIYSLGVIAYQMLAGGPPFAGDMTTVMRQHLETAPPDLRAQNKKLPKRVARVIMSTLAKDPADRPQTAAAFANALHANADGLGVLYRRAFALYSEYFPKFVKLSLLAHIPLIIVTLAAFVLSLYEARLGKVWTAVIAVPLALMQIAATFITTSIISGVTAIIVTQLAVAPMKPVELRAAFSVLRQRWRPFLRTGLVVAFRIILGFCLLIVPGIVVAVRYLLWGPVVLMEGLEKKAARKRARELASRSWRTIIVVTMIQFLVPMVIGGVIGALSGATAGKAHKTISVRISTQLSTLLNVFIVPLMSIVPALLYLKMRQLGGETLNDVMAQLQEFEGARSQWQQRMRSRLTAHTAPKVSSGSKPVL